MLFGAADIEKITSLTKLISALNYLNFKFLKNLNASHRLTEKSNFISFPCYLFLNLYEGFECGLKYFMFWSLDIDV